MANEPGNELAKETSPYLLQHKDNPVHWVAWGEAALARAEAENRPILLSVGYAACHWCHVMAHESFEDAETAAVMNELFVCIKVDREERPDIDAIYQQALALTGEQGGWPLTMFLTPAREPFWGGTYFPPTPRYGRPAFRDLLVQLHEVWRDKSETVAKNTEALRGGLDRLSRPADAAEVEAGIPLALMDGAARQLLGAVDEVHGGLGGAPKFPQPHVFEFLWRAGLRTSSDDLKGAVTLTLDRMCQGGIYDHLLGGFARYSTDEVWLAPHFEKMLYDNALLIELMTRVWRATHNPLYATRVRETVHWALTEMRDAGGAFAGALDADSEGEEGRFYVWHEPEIDELLGDDAAAFKQAYDVRPAGNWEGKTILNRTDRPELLDGPGEAALGVSRNILLAARATRVRPGRDDKVLADWNGLLISALAEAGATFAKPEWLDAARQAFAFIVNEMSSGGRLHHSYCDGRLTGGADGPAFLDDYANMARAALALYEVDGAPGYLAQATDWAGVLKAHYRDAEFGGYFFTADDAERLISRTRNATDNAAPAGNGTIVGVLARLYYLTGDAAWRAEAEFVIKAFAGETRRNFVAIATLMSNAEFLEAAVQIVVIGARGEAAAEALIEVAFATPEPNRLLVVVAPEIDLPQGHPARGKTQIEGRASAYVCRGPVCSLPVTQPEDLATLLGP